MQFYSKYKPKSNFSCENPWYFWDFSCEKPWYFWDFSCENPWYFIPNINQNQRLLNFLMKIIKVFDEVFDEIVDFMLVTKNYY